MDEELFDIYDAHARPLGVKPRSQVHRDGDWHRSIHLWLIDRPRAALIVQRRGPGKDTLPSRFDASVGGHLSAGESHADALREVEEELGVAMTVVDVLPLGIVPVVHCETAVIDRELCLVGLADAPGPPQSYPFDRGELAGVASLSLVAFERLLAGERVALSYFDGRTVETLSVGRDEFVGHPYLAGLAQCARRYVTGERDLLLPGASPFRF